MSPSMRGHAEPGDARFGHDRITDALPAPPDSIPKLREDGTLDVPGTALDSEKTSRMREILDALPPVVSGVTGRDLQDEFSRTYHFASGSTYTVYNPMTLYTRPGGTTHRVLDKNGLVHCVAFPGPQGDTVLTWTPREAEKPVAF